jgi:hypothetical protein
MKYYQIKQEGKWFAKTPGADADANIQDGREYRSWTFGSGDSKKEGKTLGWFKQSLEGLITGSEVKPLGEDMVFCIYLDTGDVAQFKLYESNFLSLANVLAGIDLSRPVKMDAALNEKRAWKNKYGKMVVPTALYINQGSDRLPQTWAYDESIRWFAGLPKPVIVEKFGRSVRDVTAMNAAFDEQLDQFVQRVENFSASSQPAETSADDFSEEDVAF